MRACLFGVRPRLSGVKSGEQRAVNEGVMKEPSNINTTTVQPTPTATVYGMPAYSDRAAAEPLRSLHGS